MITRQNMAALMAPFLRKIFFDRYNKNPEEFRTVLNVHTSSRAYETNYGISGFGTVPARPEGTVVTFDDPIGGYSAKYVHVGYALGYQLTREAFRDDQYKILGSRMSRQLGRSANETRETIAANLLNNAFTDTGPDGVSLIHAAHPLTGGGTSANRPATDAALTMTSLQAMIQTFANQRDDRNKTLMLRPRFLIVPPALEFTARTLLNSTLLPGGANNDINPIKDSLDIVVMRRLTSTTAWFLVADKDEHSLNWYDREPVEFDDNMDWARRVAQYLVEWRSSVGYDDWRGVAGTDGVP